MSQSGTRSKILECYVEKFKFQELNWDRNSSLWGKQEFSITIKLNPNKDTYITFEVLVVLKSINH